MYKYIYMKTAITILVTMVLISLNACTSTRTNIEQTAEQEKIATLVQAGNFVYEASSANPLRISVLDILPNGTGQQLRQLSPGYYLSVSADTLKAKLPFFGRSYQAELDPSKAGIEFETTDFKYNYSKSKKGYYNITIKVSNQKSADRFNLTVSKDGYSTLQVHSIQLDPISFYGRLTPHEADILNSN